MTIKNPVQEPKSVKARITRASLVVAAADILQEKGPNAVTYRSVAQRAKVAASSTGYYFSSIADLLYEAGERNMSLWAKRAEAVADAAETMDVQECRMEAVELFLSAAMPSGSGVSAPHYMQLIAASESPAVTRAYREGRKRLDAAVSRIIKCVGLKEVTPRFVIALVDGAAVSAVSEGESAHARARAVLAEWVYPVMRNDGLIEPEVASEAVAKVLARNAEGEGVED